MHLAAYRDRSRQPCNFAAALPDTVQRCPNETEILCMTAAERDQTVMCESKKDTNNHKKVITDCNLHRAMQPTAKAALLVIIAHAI